MSDNISSTPEENSNPLLEKSELVSQTSHGPTLSVVASQMLQQKLTALYPALNIDPDKTLVGTPQWQVVNDKVEAGQSAYESLTHALVRQSLYGEKANYLAGEHFLTLEPDTDDPVHLAVDIEEIAELLNDSASQLFIELQTFQLDFWNHTGHKTARWQELSNSLQKALNVKAVKGWDADECAMAREVFNNPDSATRKNANSDLSNIQASLIDIDTVENKTTTHLLLGGALVLQAKLRERELLVMYTIESGYESFSSLQQLGDSLPARLEQQLAGRDMTWRLFQPDGNVFDYMACALVTSQLDAIAALQYSEAPASTDIPQQPGLDTTQAARFKQLNTAIPQWLSHAAVEDIQDYGRYIRGLSKLYRDPEHIKVRDDIPSITAYAQRLMSEAIIADSSASAAVDLPLDQLRIKITNSFTAGNFTLPNPLDHRIVTLAEFAMENEAPYMATISFTQGDKVPQWLTPAFLTTIAAQVDIGQAYPAMIKKVLIDDNAQSERQQKLYCDQLRWLLPLLALECKVKQSGKIDERGYRYVCDLLSQDTTEADPVGLYPLTLSPQHRLIASSDTVSNMFIISPRNATDGPCVLYRPMMDTPLMQFASRQNLLYAMHQPGELRESVLAWLPDKTLSFEYAQYVFPVGIPSPWLIAEQLVSPTMRAEKLGWVLFENEEITGDILSALFSHNAQALAALADRQSQSNAERRWTLLRESGEALLAVTSNFLSGAVGAAVWVWQTINQIQQALDANERKDNFSEWTSMSDILLTIGIILSHHAVLRYRTLSGRVADTSLPIEEKATPRNQTITVTHDPVSVTAQIPSWTSLAPYLVAVRQHWASIWTP